jgi:hypothetical protein
MDVILTTCTAEKDQRREPVAAGLRYRGPRVDEARSLARERGLQLVFLSGVYGVLGEHEPVPWYDHALQPAEVEGLVGTVAEGLLSRGITGITAVVRPRETPGWAPYHVLLEEGAAAARVVLRLRTAASAGTA